MVGPSNAGVGKPQPVFIVSLHADMHVVYVLSVADFCATAELSIYDSDCMAHEP